jgi:subtilisin family serine protease
MRRSLLTSGLLVVLALAGCSPDAPSPAAPTVETAQAPSGLGPQTVDVIVVLQPDAAPGGHGARQAEARRVARGLGFAPGHAYGTALYGFSATIPAGRLNALRLDPRVAYVELDQIARVPTPGPGQSGLCDVNPTHPKCGGGGGDDPPSSQVVPWGVARVGGAGNGAGKTAWVIDTGIDLDHPDLNVDVGRSVSFVTKGKYTPDDGNGHGTHVAGTIGAKNNGQDVVGVAAGATLVAVRVLDNGGSGTYSAVIAGVDHVGANGASGDVANMSLGGPASTALDDAVRAAASQGIEFVLAAGNSGAHANNYSPARANGTNITTVSAFAPGDTWASFSNYGNPPIDWAAPGVSVLSTRRGGGTTTLSGTSMAAPHVAGLLLLGNVSSDGLVTGDPDGNRDPIAHR